MIAQTIHLPAVHGAFSPLSLSPSLWLKADASTYQEKASPGTTLASADGDPVGTWRDLSGNARHYVAPSDAARPTLKLAIQNGKPVVRYDGVDDVLNRVSSFTVGDFSLFAVMKASSGNAGRVVMAASPGYLGLIFSTDGKLYYYEGTNNPATTITTFNGAMVLAESIRSGTTWTGYKNGTSGGGGTVLSTTQTVAHLGRDDGASGFDFAEVLLYPTALSTGNRQSVETYLNGRWNVY